MRRLALLLLPLALFAGPARYARLGEFEGPVEVQLTASDSWIPAERNLPLIELSWIRTGPGARVEIELDEGSVWRLGPETQGEISDYSRLSTGQRVTLLSIDHGVAWLTGKPALNDSLSISAPGAQAVFTKGGRVRVEARGAWSQISVLDGATRFSSLAAEIDLPQGLFARVEPGSRDRFVLERKIAPIDLDAWCADRDKQRVSTSAQLHVLARYGLTDLDANGTWVDTQEFGAVWKPKIAEGWVPFQKGRWRWYDSAGYTWVSDDAWGWLPYHYGRWAVSKTLGWVWAPSVRQVFEPGDVYWLQGAKLAGWGPLAPGEHWTPAAQPLLFANLYTTYALLQADARVIDPSGFTSRPDEPLGAATFAAALPSPLFPASRLEALRPVLQAGSTRLKPVVAGVTYGSDTEPETVAAALEPRPSIEEPPTPRPALIIMNPAQNGAPMFAEAPSPDPVVVAYPVLEGILTIPVPTPARASGAPPKTATADTAPAGSAKPAKPSGSKPPSATAGNTTEPSGRTPEVPKRGMGKRESEIYAQAIRHSSDAARLLEDLETWSGEFPHSTYADERTALYVQAYTATKPPQPAKALELGAQLMARNLKTLFPDPDRGPVLILSVLYSMTLSSWNVPRRTAEQTAAALAAATELTNYAPVFFAANRKPAEVSADAWAQSRTAVETTARQTAALLAAERGAGARRPGAKN